MNIKKYIIGGASVVIALGGGYTYNETDIVINGRYGEQLVFENIQDCQNVREELIQNIKNKTIKPEHVQIIKAIREKGCRDTYLFDSETIKKINQIITDNKEQIFYSYEEYKQK